MVIYSAVDESGRPGGPAVWARMLARRVLTAVSVWPAIPARARIGMSPTATCQPASQLVSRTLLDKC